MTELIFIFVFLPVALLGYWSCNGRARLLLLIALNMLFYGWIVASGVGALIISVLCNLLFTRLIFRFGQGLYGKLILFLGIVLNVAPLFYFKYSGFFIESFLFCKNIEIANLIVPVGISFYTFKAISLLVDVYKSKQFPDLLRTVIYLTFFGQIISGPLSRIEDFAEEEPYSLVINRDYKRIFECISDGMVLFSIGLVKKVLIADVLGNVVSEVFVDAGTISSYGAPMLWLGSICFSLQLFLDFSGYSDMAIGVSKMFGYNCPTNFNYPYMTKSFSEFWRRWHISLGLWFRDYVYIPCGGSRVSNKYRLVGNLMLVWMITGLWHGANWTFIFWGITYGSFVSFEKISDFPGKLPPFGKWMYRGIILFVVNIEWVIFKSESLAYAWTYLKGMFGFGGAERTARAMFLLEDYAPFIILSIVCCMPVIQYIENIGTNKGLYVPCLVFFRGVLFMMVLISIAFIISGSNNPFAYANF